jgi:hypothetical protein
MDPSKTSKPPPEVKPENPSASGLPRRLGTLSLAPNIPSTDRLRTFRPNPEVTLGGVKKVCTFFSEKLISTERICT